MSTKIFLTGASGGLGTVVAKIACQQKIPLYGLYMSNETSILKSQKEFLSSEVDFQKQAIDFSGIETLPKALESIKNPESYSDVILCHGKNVRAPLLSASLTELKESMNINYYSSFLIAQFFIKVWREHNLGNRTITYIGSVATETTAPNEVPYHSAKRAMQSAMKSFYRAYSEFDLRFNIISPGLMDTPMGQDVLKTRPEVIDNIPLKRLTRVEDIASMCFTIIENKSITGQNIHINAGRYSTI